MNTALERIMHDQQARIQMLANIASQRMNGAPAFNAPTDEADDTTNREGVSSATSTHTPTDMSRAPGPSTSSRSDAIAKLKRAASQRETRGRGADATTSGAQTPLEDAHTASESTSAAHGDGSGLQVMDATNRLEAPSPFQARSVGSDGNKSVSPIPPGLLRVEQLRSGSPSPQRIPRDLAGTPEGLLARSRSQRGDARSPLPSLEQLRARILQERASAGLARSASTSASSNAASAAARAYALEKLLGESPRQGAVSPVSETGEDQEEEEKAANGKEESTSRLIVASTSQRLLLRRSRTIGGLSAAAEAQRKAAFVQALDEGVPEDVKSIRRSSRRFAKAPPGSRTSTSSKPSDPPIFEERQGLSGEAATEQVAEKDAGLQVPAEGLGTDSDRNQSQRQIARTEMMRKLSTRGRNGQKSPIPPVAAADEVGASTNPIDAAPFAYSSLLPPVTPPAGASLTLPPISPSSNLLTVPGAGHTAQSPSSRPSTGMTSLHESDRNRASEMARLMGEEAFEYERLLEMGYTTDDAYERVASARSGSYMDLSANVSPRSYQGDFSHAHMMEQQPSPLLNAVQPSRALDQGLQEMETPLADFGSKQDEWPTFASIPLGLATSRASSDVGDAGGRGEAVELLDNDIIMTPTRRAAWPESVVSASTFDTSSSPKHSSSSTQRDSDVGGSSSYKPKPLNLTLASMQGIERIEEVLSPGFLKDIGNPLDYNVSSDSTFSRRESKGNYMASEGDADVFDVGEPGREGDDDDGDYLQKVDQMTRKLGQFARRNNDTNASREDRDAAVQQSSAAQAIAAASQDAQQAEPSSAVMASGLTASLAGQQHSNAATPRSSPPTSFRPLTGSRTHSATNSADSTHYINNGKLSPFPGLFPQPSVSAETSTTSLVRKPSPLLPTANDSLGKAVYGQDVPEEKKTDPASAKRPTFFTSLRRKASNAASRAQDNLGAAGPSSASPTSRKFGSLLRRKASEAKHSEATKEPESPVVSSQSLTPTNTVKQASSSDAAVVGPRRIESRELPPAPPPKELSPLNTASTAALHRYSRMLTSPREASNAVGVLGLTRQDIEHPPRSFLFATPVLQVMTTSTVKDRYLFVFSDVLVIAKPIAPPEVADGIPASNLPTLEWTFSVKDILDISQIKQLTTPTDERRRPARNVALMGTFAHEFHWNPQQAIDSLIEQSGLARSPATIAQLLQQTPELDCQQLTNYLFDDAARWDVTKAFIELEKLSGVSIESALRSLLLEIRFPSRKDSFEDMLVLFAKQWTRSNRDLIKETFTEQIAIDLVCAIMTLNDALHGADHSTPAIFCDPHPHWPKEDFLHAFRARDEGLVLSDRTLSRIYTSISQEAIQQALTDNEAGPRLTARILSPGIPARLIYGVYSNPIRISVSRCDPDFTIRLYGEDLAFQPQVLTFGQSSTQEFRVMSKSLGSKSIVFIKSGRNARHYQTTGKTDVGRDFALPRSASLVVERAFKQHCFSIASSGSPKYTLSVEGETKKNRCVDSIKEGMAQLASDPSRKGSAHTLALQVLKEALMEADVPPSLQRSASAAVPPSSSRMDMATLNRAPSDSRAFSGSAIYSRTQMTPVNRKESVSKHYYQSQGKREKGLAPSMDNVDEEEAAPKISNGYLPPLRGEELVVTVKQNSLLSVVVARLRQDSR